MSSHIQSSFHFDGSESPSDVLPPPNSALPDVLDPRDVRPVVREALKCWLTFQSCMGLDARGARRLLCEGGGIEGALRRVPEGKRGVLAIGDAAEGLLECGAVVLPILSSAYPERLKRLLDAPPLLFVRGDVSVLAAPIVAIVGSRAATVYGLGVAREFAGELARAGLTIVSGLAFGVDAAGHRAALEAGGRSIAVQACGIDIVYPAVHAELASEISNSGAVVSEFALGTRPLKGYFPLRNRSISGLSRAVIVVEARERSGSLITARLAADQGVDVFAVPGPITAPTSAGTNRLLRDGAWVAVEPSDVLEVLEIDAASPVERAALKASEFYPSIPMSQSTEILEVLQAQPESRDELSRRLGCSPAQLDATLLHLELEGLVAEDRDGRLRVSGRASGSARLQRRRRDAD